MMSGYQTYQDDRREAIERLPDAVEWAKSKLHTLPADDPDRLHIAVLLATVDPAEWAADPSDGEAAGEAWWTAEQVAEHAGIAIGSVAKWCSRYDVARVLMSKAADVQRIKATMPGKAWRLGKFTERKTG